ncbi:glycosyltransferase family 2 protein [Flavobacterium restrictum]|uniref:Glycosyltransferase n=1 Tax=Flavobacterium restrictum TaxID=2594428 RepID=A0A553EB27_9FLAO|nr:glycosyltransferase [Flavobacterium restrictum]TRX42162.1 glycosyltransferase [Flavobacterium restrictum]
MNHYPLVSIICLCYNHEKFVTKALDSVLNQTYSNIELLIVDDYSTDNSSQVIKEWLLTYPTVTCIQNTKNMGNTKSFNNAFALSKGDFIIDLAADDILNTNAVELQLHAFQTSSFKNLGIVYGNVELIFEDSSHFKYFFKVDKNKKRIQPQPTGDIYIGLLSLQNNVCSVSAMAKRIVYESLNGYNENLYYEDFDFWIRAARHYTFDFIDEVLMKKRELRNSLSAQRFKRLNKKTRKFNRSTYQIVTHALELNQTTAENRAILKMIHFEMEIAIRTIDPILFLKYVGLETKIIKKLLFTTV